MLPLSSCRAKKARTKGGSTIQSSLMICQPFHLGPGEPDQYSLLHKFLLLLWGPIDDFVLGITDVLIADTCVALGFRDLQISFLGDLLLRHLCFGDKSYLWKECIAKEYLERLAGGLYSRVPNLQTNRLWGNWSQYISAGCLRLMAGRCPEMQSARKAEAITSSGHFSMKLRYPPYHRGWRSCRSSCMRVRRPVNSEEACSVLVGDHPRLMGTD